MTTGDVLAGVVGLSKVAAGIDRASMGTVAFRRGVCRNCEHATVHISRGLTSMSRCLLCGCFIGAKTRIRSERCPTRKW